MKTRDTRFIYRHGLDKACFQHDSAYSDSKDLIKRTQSDKLLKEKVFNIAKNPKYDGYQRGLASMVYKFLDKNLDEVVLKKISNKLMNFINQLLENSREEKCIHLLKVIFGVLI